MMASFLVADFTSLQPSWQDSEGNEGTIWPSYCLPWFRGEPPLVGEASRIHRRASQTESFEPEARLNLNNRGRWHWAEGWLGMTKSPDSIHPANVRMTWRPPGEKKDVSISFPAALGEALRQTGVETRNLGLIVPSALGPGPRQELLDELQKDFRGEILFIPRPIAAALSWSNSDSGRELLNSTSASPSSRCGSLLVTTAGADIWEAAAVPIRLEERGSNRYFCPVQDRTQISSEIGVVGLAWKAGGQHTQGTGSFWRAALLPERATHSHEVTRSSYSFASKQLASQLDESGVAPQWVPIDFFEEALTHIKAICETGDLLDSVHCGIRNGKSPPGRLAAFEREVEIKPQILQENGLLLGAVEAMRKIIMGLPPFYEALAPLELHVISRNRFQDPVSDWEPLLEETEVPAGEEYKSPRPITGLSLPEGSSSIELFIRTKRRGTETFYQITAEQNEVLRKKEDVFVTARMRPGRGLSHVEIHSITPHVFDVTIHEGRLEESESPPPLKYAWPPGSAYVVSHPVEAAAALPGIQRVIHEDRGKPVSSKAYKKARELMNKWLLPSQIDTRYASSSIPAEIHPLFVYYGTFPSSKRKIAPILEKVFAPFLRALERSVKQTNPNEQHPALWTASWLYAHCPDSILEEVRNELKSDPPIHGSILGCAGNCFTTLEDFRLFFTEFAWCVRNHDIAPMWWLRAYRNLARFRHEALSLEALSKQDQKDLLRWVLNKYERSLRDPAGKDFLHCTYLAPHLLKRRRFDPDFLSWASPSFNRMDLILNKAISVALSVKHRSNAECALEFLHSRATTATLQKLSELDEN